jgi:hypothetical protein
MQSVHWGPKTAHPSRDAISVFRCFKGGPNQEAVVINLFSASHNLSVEEFRAQNVPSSKLSMESNQVLFVKGSLWIEVTVPPGVSLVWQGFSKSPLGANKFSLDALPFMTF